MAMNGLESLKRHQKCMRLATRALVSAAKAKKLFRSKPRFSKRDSQNQQEAELRALRMQLPLLEERFNPEVF